MPHGCVRHTKIRISEGRSKRQLDSAEREYLRRQPKIRKVKGRSKRQLDSAEREYLRRQPKMETFFGKAEVLRPIFGGRAARAVPASGGRSRKRGYCGFSANVFRYIFPQKVMRNAKKRILRFRDQNFLYICLPENHRAASGRPKRCAPIKTATHGTRLCNRFGLRNGFRARPAGRCPHGAGDRLRSGALSPLEQGALQRSPRGSFPPTSQGLSRSAASGGACRDRPPCRSGALRPGAVGRYDGQHPLPDRQGGSSPLAARGVRRKPRRDVRAVEGPYGAGRMRGDQRSLCPLRDQLRLPFGQLLLGRMFLVEGAAPVAPGRSAAARRLVGRRTV